jgi:hypothetical protein
MKRSTHSMVLGLGCAAMLAGASACSRGGPEPSSPPQSTTPGRSPSAPLDQSPASTGGSNTLQPGFDGERERERDTQGTMPQGGMPQGQQGGMPQGQPGMTQPGGAPLPGQQGVQAGQESTGAGATPQGAQGSQPGTPGTTGGTVQPLASINEREACDLLMADAMLHTEAIEGGVAIVAKPRRNVEVSTVRDRMTSIHHGIERGGPSSPAAECELFALGRSGVASLIETPDSIRLLVTTSDAARVPQLRRQATEFMRSKGGPASRGTTPQGGTRGGGTPPPGDKKPQPGTP